jgi:outer membrane protein assembly factor BamB
MKARLCLLVTTAVLLGSSNSFVIAQIGIQPNFASREELFLPAPRALQRLLAEGRSAIEDGRYAEGIASLGMILQDDNDGVPADLRGQDFFLRRGRDVDPNNRGRNEKPTPKYSSIKTEAIKELNRLNDEGRRALEIQFGVRARQVLEEVIAKRDLEMIATVARRYIHTEAGYDAMVLIAQNKVTNGYPLAAADILQSMLDYPAARERFGVGLVEAAAVCWLQAGNRARATSTLKLAARDFPDQSLTIGGQQIPIENWNAILTALDADHRERSVDRSTSSWLVSGGTAARNATSQVGLPLPNERWSWSIHSSRPEGLALQQAEEVQRKSGRQLLPKIELRMLGDIVISRSNDSAIIGLDFETGLLKWQRRTPVGVAPLKGSAWDRDKDLSQELKNRIWGSNSFGRISCDSQRCYHVVQKQGEIETIRGMGMGPRTTSSTRLEGLSIANEGEILWSLGGSDSDDPTLTTAYFLGPPLPYAGQLYTLVELNGQVELIVLEPETGKLQWRQQLSSTPFQIEIDPSRQSQGLTPSISDGVIICPTGTGGIVAMDLMTRTLRWATSYLKTQGLNAINGAANLGGDYDPLDSRWADESLIIENGIVAATPQDSEFLLAFDLLTGEELVQRRRENACYVAGIRNQDLIVVNNSSVQALDVSLRGASRWQALFPEQSVLAGKGLWSEGKLLLPVTGNKVIQVDLEQGQIVDSAVVSQPLGNIFSHRGALLSVTPTAITSYYTRQQLKTSVDERLAKDPQDIWGLNYRSQLMLAEGKVSEAFDTLLDAHKIAPDDFETRYFLVDAMLVGLQKDFKYFSKFSTQLDSIVLPTTPHRLRYLQLLAQGLVEQGDHFEAFKRLWDIMLERQMAVVSGAQNQTNQIQLAPGHNVDLDAWFAIELGRTYDQCTPEQQAEIQDWVKDVFTKLKTTVITVRRQILRHMVHLPAADKENLELARSLLKSNEQTSAEQILVNLATRSNSAVRDEALSLLHELPEADRAMIKQASNSKPLTPWPQGMVVRQLDEIEDAIYPVGRPIEVSSKRFGRPAINMAVSDRLVLFDADGKVIHSLLYRPATGDVSGMHLKADMRGGLMLLESSTELIGVDYYRGRDTNQSLLWRYSLEAASPREIYRGGAVFATSNSAPLGIQRVDRSKLEERPYVDVGPLLTSAKIILSSGSIVGIDPYSGRKLWSRDGYGKVVTFAGASDGNLLCVISPTKGKTEFLDARDGKLVKQNEYLVDEMSLRWRDKIKPDWEQWFVYENWVTDYLSEEGGATTLRVWNPQTEKTLYENKLPENARVAQCNRNTIAILHPTGQLQLIELVGERVHTFDVPVNDEVVQIGILKFANHLLIVTNTDRSVFASQLSSGIQAHGNAYCIDTTNYQLAWKTPGYFQSTAIPQIQPRNSPLVAICRTISTVAPGPPVLGLMDLRTGKLVYTVDGVKVDRTTTFSMELRQRTHELTIMINERFFRFKATDIEPPPEPIVHFGSVYISETPDEKPEIQRDVNLFDK